MMSILHAVVIVSLILVPANEGDTLQKLTDEESSMFGNLKFETLPERVKEILRLNRATDNGDNWCCKINPTKTIVDSHQTTVRITIQVKHTNSHHCGFLWLNRCHSTSYTAGYKTGYKPMYTSRVVPTTCPDEHLTCCKDYVRVADHCIPQSRIPDIKDDLINLNNAGILIG